MFQTLYRRLLIVILTFGLAMTLIFAVILFVYHDAYHTEADQTVNRRLAQQYAAARLLITDEPLTVQNFHEGIKRLAGLNPDVDIYLVDPGGSLVASSVPEPLWARRRIDLAPVRAFLQDNASLPIFGDNPRLSTGAEIFSAAPIDIQDCPARYLYVVLHRDSQDSAVRQLRRAYTINESLGLLISCGVLAVAATLILIRSITRRLSRLKTDMERFQAATVTQGQGSAIPAVESPGDEIDGLAGMFRELSSRVQSQMQTLQDTDDMRRNMVANISHDLRTPLTTLQAHLDTLLAKEKKLTAEERHQYLTTAGDQVRRLTRLVAQLLELAKLDARQVAPRMEPFHPAELIQDIAQKLTLSASAAHAQIRTDYANTLPLVFGDISLIERAIDNLVDNAIQHSPPGGVVTLRAALTANHRVRLEVEDSGPGIPLEEQKRIFDRFYRADQSRSSEPSHAGLGLAIVRGILELHGATIAVHSTPGAGTRFSFELAAQGS